MTAKNRTDNLYYGCQLIKKGRWGTTEIFYKMFDTSKDREGYIERYIRKNPINSNKVLKINRFSAEVTFE